MLTPVDDAPAIVTTGASGPDKQICAEGANANTIVYTVPAGRKFKGWASNYSQANGSRWVIFEDPNGNQVRHFNDFANQPTSYQTNSAPEVTLLAGTVVKVGNGSTVYCFGVESDA